MIFGDWATPEGICGGPFLCEITVTLTVFLVGLGGQFVLWPCLYFLAEGHFARILRRRRAQGNMSNSGHYGEVIMVFAIIFLLCWILYPAVLWVRGE